MVHLHSLPALDLHLAPEEFVTAAKFCLGLPLFPAHGPCPTCQRPSDTMGDHALCCSTGGERIARHDGVCKAI